MQLVSVGLGVQMGLVGMTGSAHETARAREHKWRTDTMIGSKITRNTHKEMDNEITRIKQKAN